MKYAIIDTIKNGDSFENIFDTEAEAIKAADKEWNHLSNYDKHRRLTYAVVFAELDEDECVDMNTAVFVKQYK